MSIILILGIIVPIIYILRLNIQNEIMTLKRAFITITLSIFGITITSLIGSIVTKQLSDLIYVLIGAIFTGILWGILLVGSYILLYWISRIVKK